MDKSTKKKAIFCIFVLILWQNVSIIFQKAVFQLCWMYSWLEKSPGREGWRLLLAGLDDGQDASLRAFAAEAARKRFGNGVFIRGLVEISSWCRNNCYYCGLRRSNRFASRYRLSQEQILDCCREGARLGFGTFVLQGGEDTEQDDDWIEDLIGKLRMEFPRHAITLSVGERDGEVYRRWRDAGAGRYLLRHETRNEAHYARLHPREMDGARRRECLRTLKALGVFRQEPA